MVNRLTDTFAETCQRDVPVLLRDSGGRRTDARSCDLSATVASTRPQVTRSCSRRTAESRVSSTRPRYRSPSASVRVSRRARVGAGSTSHLSRWARRVAWSISNDRTCGSQARRLWRRSAGHADVSCGVSCSGIKANTRIAIRMSSRASYDGESRRSRSVMRRSRYATVFSCTCRSSAVRRDESPASR